MLVGTKTDMRDDRATLKSLRERGRPVITYEMGQHKAKELQAKKYVNLLPKITVNFFRLNVLHLLKKD